MLEPGLFSGQIRHRRLYPTEHQFTYRMYWSLLDVQHLKPVFAQSRLWSIERWNLVGFKREDYHGCVDQDIHTAVSATIRERTGEDFDGRVYMLSHLRYLGFNFNSVCFYFCYSREDLSYILCEITNTPWGERHTYVLKCKPGHSEKHSFAFDKTFHVSPFLPMELHYRWRFVIRPRCLNIYMGVHAEQGKVFEVSLSTRRSPFNKRVMRRNAILRPWQPLKMLMAIYWQALKLYVKRTEFYPHPKHRRHKEKTDHG